MAKTRKKVTLKKKRAVPRRKMPVLPPDPPVTASGEANCTTCTFWADDDVCTVGMSSHRANPDAGYWFDCTDYDVLAPGEPGCRVLV